MKEIKIGDTVTAVTPSDEIIHTQVTVKLSISRRAWEEAYGTDGGIRTLKADIKQYAANTIIEQLRAVGMWADEDAS